MVRHAQRRQRGRARSARGGQGGGPSRSPRRGSRRAPHAPPQRLAGVRSPLPIAWLAWLGLVLPAQGALGEEPGAPTPGTTERGPAAAEDAQPAQPGPETAAPKTSRHRFPERHVRRRQRIAPDPRLADLAARSGKVAAVAHLRGAASIKPAGPMAAATEHKIKVQTPDKPPGPAQPALPAVAASATALDESIVKEITQRKVLFRMCYESARRRGVLATRADVKWTLAADGSVHDVEVVVAQDAQLANCIRVIASRPFAGRVGQDIPVAIPLLFVSMR